MVCWNKFWSFISFPVYYLPDIQNSNWHWWSFKVNHRHYRITNLLHALSRLHLLCQGVISLCCRVMARMPWYRLIGSQLFILVETNIWVLLCTLLIHTITVCNNVVLTQYISTILETLCTILFLLVYVFKWTQVSDRQHLESLKKIFFSIY